MKIIKPSYEILSPINREEFLKTIEIAGRTCYKSEEKITEISASKFVRMLIKSKHYAMIEHALSISVKFICDRGVSHEIVRHRLFSFDQESTRYCNYGKLDEITVIQPCFFDPEEDTFSYRMWLATCQQAESGYMSMLRDGCSPQEARSVLSNSLKTEIIVTGNVREWMHFFELRTAKTAHPQMREIAIPLLEELKGLLPEIFENIKAE